MARRFPAVLLTWLLVACGSASPEPTAPAEPTAAPPPQKPQRPAGPLRVRLEAKRVFLGSEEHLLRTPFDFPQQPTPRSPEAFQLVLGEDATGASLNALLEASSEAGWPIAELANQGPAIRLRLASTSSVPASTELTTILLWPQLLHAGRLSLPEGNDPIDGVSSTTFPYGINVRGTSQCSGGSCDQVRLQVSPVTPLSEVRDVLNQVALANAGPVEALLIGGEMRPPGATLVGVGHTTVAGRLPPAEIQRVVRAAYGDFRKCYEDGLRRDASLTGKVTVRFVIGRDGKASHASVDPQATNIPDTEVVDCILRHYDALQFPKPEGGIVTVVYPIFFSPGE
ncbi:MAG: AgmX/PglI C-terminal domain-containing protein [Polyangiaceae bacterium]|nr:AgmX/PglI C-terminal domain-containing protein [Polyangiaceae bacterium]